MLSMLNKRGIGRKHSSSFHHVKGSMTIFVLPIWCSLGAFFLSGRNSFKMTFFCREKMEEGLVSNFTMFFWTLW